jgi:hypothetical protein
MSGDRHPQGGEGMQAAREKLCEHDARVGAAMVESKLATEARWVPDVGAELFRRGYLIDGTLCFLGLKSDNG